MAEMVEFFYDVGNPEAYLVQTRIDEVCREKGAILSWRAAVDREVRLRSGRPEPDAAAWEKALAARAAKLGVPFTWNPHAPFYSALAMRLVVAAEEHGLHVPLLKRLFQAAWAEGADISDDQVLAALSDEVRVPGRSYLQRSRAGHVDRRLVATAQEAIERGVVELPAICVGAQVFAGPGALADLERALP